VYGQHKGIPRRAVDAAVAAGDDVVLRLDVQGAATVRALLPGCVSVFLTAESEAALAARLAARGTESGAALAARVAAARAEAARASEFDYVIVNAQGDVDGTVDALCAVMDAEKLRAARRLPPKGG
jgi:guanylate kinase